MSEAAKDYEETIGRDFGLHEEVRIIYVVDGYEASMEEDDGARVRAVGRGETISAALDALGEALREKAGATGMGKTDFEKDEGAY